MKRLLSAALLISSSISSYAEQPLFNASDWGTTGLLQMPTARMPEAGEVAFTLSRTDPYVRYNFTLQPLPWLEAGFRYIDIKNRLYGPVIAGNQSMKDKSIDAKFRLWPESRYLPQLAVGMRDIGGTGLFSGEYVVASKRWGDIDFHAGLGWGNIGARGDITNPFTWISDRFKQRQNTSVVGGTANTKAFFRGNSALFAGLQYQTPWQPLQIKLEYEGNDYQSEPQANNQKQDSAWNAALLYQLSPGILLQAGLERGNTASLGIIFRSNVAQVFQPKPLDPPLYAWQPPKKSGAASQTAEARQPTAEPLAPEEAPSDFLKKQQTEQHWATVSQQLKDNAGLKVLRFRQKENELIVEAEPQKYRSQSETAERLARILQANTDENIEWFTLESQQKGLRSKDFLINREASMQQQQAQVEVAPPAQLRAETLYTPPQKTFDPRLGLGYSQSVGGPDGFLLYQFSAVSQATWQPRPDFWIDGELNVRFLDNYDKFKYTGPSLLPRVRTHIREYLTTSHITLPILQATKTWQPTGDIYLMGYAGLLESMYAGVGGEWLYRPYGEHWALGVDINAVQQRDFRQDFGLRSYQVLTGHATAYIETGVQDILAKIQIGRYLAKDEGITLDFSRQFRNGVAMGAFATFTNVSRVQFGEGGFDKGIYITIPFDLMLARSSRNAITLLWNPLTRDGGQRLARRHSLYELSSDRGQSAASQ